MRFNKLVKRHRDRIYTFARYMLGNREDAEDVTQEVLVALWKSLGDLDPQGITPWLMRVTRNACIDMYRRRATFSKFVQVDSEDVGFDRALSTEPAPDRVVEAHEVHDRIMKEILQLPETQRSAIIMREIQDLRYDTIAEALGIPLNSVKVYIHRARRSLRERLQTTLEYESRTT
jgi:RNA polymerase sigma-70 factor (ECF subfamily)